jgi:hypothetical protein
MRDSKLNMDCATLKNDTGARAMHGNSGELTSGIKAPTFDGTQACASGDADLFFPEGPKERAIKLPIARRVCSSCKFCEKCLSYALAHDVDGVWGGTTKRERRNIRKSKNLPSPRSMALLMDTLVK